MAQQPRRQSSSYSPLWEPQISLCLGSSTGCSTFTVLWCIDAVKMLHYKYLCSKHFLESDFRTAERIQLNRVEVLSGSDQLHIQSQPSVPSFHVPSLDSLPSVLTPEDDLYVRPPTRTYSKMLVTSFAVTPITIHIHAESPSTSPQIPAL
jgi:hypothetical protein